MCLRVVPEKKKESTTPLVVQVREEVSGHGRHPKLLSISDEQSINPTTLVVQVREEVSGHGRHPKIPKKSQKKSQKSWPESGSLKSQPQQVC